MSLELVPLRVLALKDISGNLLSNVSKDHSATDKRLTQKVKRIWSVSWSLPNIATLSLVVYSLRYAAMSLFIPGGKKYIKATTETATGYLMGFN